MDTKFDMTGYRPVVKLANFDDEGNNPGPAPRIINLRVDQLVINEEYQRDLSKNSLDQIRRMARVFDWRSYKALSVAPTDHPDIFEVVDGQHTAIAAVTNGYVKELPCLLQSSSDLRDKAASFIGINTSRIALTPAAIFNAKVAAQDNIAIAVTCAMSAAGVRLLTLPPNNYRFSTGDTMAISTLQEIAKKRGEERLTTILKTAVAGEAAPCSAVLIRALDLCLPLEPELLKIYQKPVADVVRRNGAARMEAVARSTTPPGERAYATLADTLADKAGLPRRRMGLPLPKRHTKWMRSPPIKLKKEK